MKRHKNNDYTEKKDLKYARRNKLDFHLDGKRSSLFPSNSRSNKNTNTQSQNDYANWIERLTTCFIRWTRRVRIFLSKRKTETRTRFHIFAISCCFNLRLIGYWKLDNIAVMRRKMVRLPDYIFLSVSFRLFIIDSKWRNPSSRRSLTAFEKSHLVKI